MNQIIKKDKIELYILKQQISVNGLNEKVIVYDETIAVCTQLSHAMKIKEENMNTYLVSI